MEMKHWVHRKLLGVWVEGTETSNRQGVYRNLRRSKGMGALVNFLVMIDHSIALVTSSVTFQPTKGESARQVDNGAYVRVSLISGTDHVEIA